MMDWTEDLVKPPGAAYLGGDRCRFSVWAPGRRVEVHLLSPEDRRVPLEAAERGYHAGIAEGVRPGARYRIRVDGADERPDPASQFQPEGVHGPSEVVDGEFPWTDGGWRGRPLESWVIYELHVGTFTPAGTFDAAAGELDGLVELGVTAVELMPVAQFPGARNWGYDGTFPFAVQESYGGPRALKRFVDACHARGLAVALDVVYNHLGPEGNAFWGLAPYFTDRYRTPWGPAMNFDGPGSDEVRRLFVENALFWAREFHVDGLRLDAVHAIVDPSARTFLEDLADAVHAAGRDLGRPVYLVAESDRNDPRLVRPPERGGTGLDAAWNDDFHHALHALLTGERQGYYQDFGTLDDLARAFSEGFVIAGRPSSYRGRRHGASSRDIEPARFVVFAQNHDQVGNRMGGERLGALVPFEKLKLAAGAVLLAPGIPLLFMGEEYGERAPFLYFVSHSDPALVEAVRRGRREEHARQGGAGEPPDPQDPSTFARSRLRRERQDDPPHRTLRELTRELIGLRRRLWAAGPRRAEAAALQEQRSLRVDLGDSALALLHFGDGEARISLPPRAGTWWKALDSADPRWDGPGSPRPERFDGGRPPELVPAPFSFAVYEREGSR